MACADEPVADNQSQRITPRRRPVLGARHRTAHLLMTMLAADQLGEIRRETWFNGACAGFALIIPRRGGPAPEGSPERQMIDEAGWSLHCLRARGSVHWHTLQAIYFRGEWVGGEAWRAALEAFTAAGAEFDQYRGPTSAL